MNVPAMLGEISRFHPLGPLGTVFHRRHFSRESPRTWDPLGPISRSMGTRLSHVLGCPWNFLQDQGCRFVPEKHFRKQSAIDGTYGSKYWFPGFGFDSGPNLQPCKTEAFECWGTTSYKGKGPTNAGAQRVSQRITKHVKWAMKKTLVGWVI